MNVSKMGLNGVLMMNIQVVACASRRLIVHERNYSTRDSELATVVFMLKIWRQCSFDPFFCWIKENTVATLAYRNICKQKFKTSITVGSATVSQFRLDFSLF